MSYPNIYPHIEKAIGDGYELVVGRDWRGEKLHARVHLGTVSSSHNFVGATMTEAMDGLERYLEKVRPDSAEGDRS